MSIYSLKPRFQALLRPLCAALFRAGATANQVTLAACVVSVLLGAGLSLFAERTALFLLLPLWLFLRMAFNAIDGMLAREFAQASKLGAYLNELTDAISDAALYLPFAFLPASSGLLVAAIVALSILSEYTGALGAMIGAGRRYDGPMGKSDRAFVFGLIGLVVGVGVEIGTFFTWLWVVLIALLALTIVNRVRAGLVAARAP